MCIRDRPYYITSPIVMKLLGDRLPGSIQYSGLHLCKDRARGCPHRTCLLYTSKWNPEYGFFDWAQVAIHVHQETGEYYYSTLNLGRA